MIRVITCTVVLAFAASAHAEPLWSVPEARQGVAVDQTSVYAIDNRTIGRYDKRSGERLAHWQGLPSGALSHLNSGVVVDGMLYCAHSNYPGVPMLSSIEVWRADTLEHVSSHSFGRYVGSATWIDRHEDSWWVMFAHYGGRGGEPGKGPEYTTLIRFDDDWRRLAAYALPPDLIASFAPYSSSGGSWGPDGLLYVTGHDGGWLYALALPDAGSTLVYQGRVRADLYGQGIAWDRSGTGRRLYGLTRADRTLRVTDVPHVQPGDES